MKQIPGFPNYSVTKDGRVWSKRRKDSLGREVGGKWLKFNNSAGYFCVVLYKNGIREEYLVHRLILETFIGLCPEGMECRHLNGHRIDNRLKNLKWGTKSENAQDAIKHGNRNTIPPVHKGEQCHLSKLTEHDVRMIIYIHRTGNFTPKEIAKLYDITPENIYLIVHRKSWKHLWKNNNGKKVEKAN